MRLEVRKGVITIKKIFDWMRKEVLDEALIDGEMHSTEDVYLSLHDIAEIINEAEAKWEADCCEWEHSVGSETKYPHHKTSCGVIEHKGIIDSRIKFCPFCGKRIKISEVE